MSLIPLHSKEVPNLLLEKLQDCYRNQSLSDVTLVSDEQGEFPAHKIILTSFSPIFRSVLPDNSEHQYVHLQGVTASVLENLLLFMYRGETFIDNEEITDFLTAARDFQLREFTEEKTPDSLYVDPCDSVQDVKIFSASDSETLEQYLQDSERLETGGTTEDLGYKVKDSKCKIKTEKNRTEKNDRVIVSSPEKKEILNQMVEKKKKRKLKLDPVSGELRQYKFRCEVCDSPYQSSVGLMFHMKAKHQGVVYPCPECDYSSSFQPNTTRHIKEKHQGKIFSCDKCDYKIGRREMMKTHIDYEHLGVRYSCQFCSYQGKEQSKLNRHVRMVHLKMKS